MYEDGVYEEDGEVDVEAEFEEETTDSAEEKITRFGSRGVHYSDGGVVPRISIISDSSGDESDSTDGTHQMNNGTHQMNDGNNMVLQVFENSGGRHIGSFRLKVEVHVDVLEGCIYVFDDGLAMKSQSA